MKWWQGLWGAADIAIAPMQRTDAVEASDIHRALFARPWTDGEIADLLGTSSAAGFIAREAAARGGAMIGFVLLRTAADEAEILTIGVRPDWQGHGIGARLMAHVLAHAHRERLASVFLEVEETNVAAGALYRKLGFATVGDRPDYYRGAAKARTRALVMRHDVAAARKAR
ncbi:MAG: ribosomal protein S18-alanine N-acetyltransferase [Roseitalea sp.]|jgi:ribosomal-protein-alanine N-acetyltransferase|uniref:Ribosomal-protein-alanine N-acetyltransferase n=1 Tax=Oceaniradius stylonematis TaxID=2184161 RepID=A0A3A8AF61_9HYPH|nr:ribosomal protein S18-alanine N-acetyltransferase [Oceaniradius stylonematis]MBO6553463.1 ribosomal protein S18-alanine N-acetyltransferase [Roseitalea sp.]MBO6952506.1 ribosomal protein S18-alanine N-acetyltransferase [Rhizobiaceae bacterium]RNC91396.1 MAG: ribosomal-protein-alanine N-acetyltransferase [Oricola sp.]MBO6593008.1 ribosomal protein S18-alanine N-acetyltransferase [Roseitalea sp.]MBO6600250.1 ribosomal protein S18-alanine N-acetyltransferase [Roseitalea sp.]